MVANEVSTSAFLTGGGELGELTRAKDWSQTAVGPPDQWPPSLRTMLSVILHARFPMFLWWGPDLVQFYNDAYRASLGESGKHPTALGQRGADCWPETWPTIQPLIDRIMAGGEAIRSDNQLIPIYRNGRLENVYWTYSYSPVMDDAGQVTGVLVVCQETTRQISQLADDQERFRFALEAAQFGVWELDPVTNLIRWDDRCAALFGLADSYDIPYEAAIAHIHPDDIVRVNETVKREINVWSGGQYDLTYRTIGASDGRLRWVRFTGRSYADPAGKVYRFGGIAHDVTKEVQTQQQLANADWQLRSLLAQAPIGIAIVRGPALVFEMVNAAYLTLVDRATPDDLIGKPLLEALPELNGQGFEDLMHGVLRTGEAFTANERRAYLLRNGRLEVCYFNLVYEPVRDRGGGDAVIRPSDNDISGIFILAAEVTPQVVARQQAEADKAYLQRVFRSAAVGIAIFRGPEFVIEVANPNVCAIWGRTEAQVVGRPLFEALPEAAGQGFEQLLTEVMRTGIPFVGTELPATINRDGQLETVYFDFVYDNLPDADGQPSRILVTASDATERRLARQRTEMSEANLRSLFRQAPVAVAILRGPAFVVELANPRMCTLWNRTEEQLLGQPVFDTLTETADQGFEQLLTAVIQTGVPFVGNEMPVPFLRDGQAKTVYVNFVYEPLRDRGAGVGAADGEITGIVVIGTDVTDQVLARRPVEQLLIRERELNELKSNFVTLASHEFRTPMATILSSASLIGRYSGPDDGEKRERHVQRIKSAVHGLTGLLNDFLSLSQMEQANMHGRPYSLNISTFCDEVIDDMQAVIKPGQRVIYTHRSGEPAISIDGQMLKNILINLLVNASKYSADDKQIELTTAVRGDQLVVTVRDEGIGIPDADKDKLFINFFRARNAIHVEGTGLGLYVVKRYVDLLGGIVTFTSQLDSGTVFTVALPIFPPST